MIDCYLILNRNVKRGIIIFISMVLFFFAIVIFGINTLYFHSFFHTHSQILSIDTNYFMEVLIPVEEVNEIMNCKKIIIDSKYYDYQVYQQSNEVIYENGINYLKLYLQIYRLENKYLLTGYQMDVRFDLGKVKIKEYLKNKEEIS